MKIGTLVVMLSGVISMVFMHSGGIRTRPQVVVDQFGYRPADKKIAFVKERGLKGFSLVDVRTRETVFTRNVQTVGTTDENTGDVVFKIDFSEWRRNGTYRIVLEDTIVSSYDFRIAPDVHRHPALAALQSFYYQRCGTMVDNETPWKHPECHTVPARMYNDPGQRKDVSGGWHDAGDYNKFIPTTAVSAAFLLYAYERQPDAFIDGQLHIPESHNGIPDILDETRYALEWMLKMQRHDGGVFHKVSIKAWTNEHLPHEETDDQYIFAVSSAATADLAAVTALGARLFERFDKEFARNLLRASLRAWEFLQANQSIVPDGGFKNPDGVEGGGYEDGRDADERLWASVELFRTTGGTGYHEYFLSHYRELGGVNYTVSWQNVQNFAYCSYLSIPVSPHLYQSRAFIIGSLGRYCDELLRRIDRNGYRHVLAPDQMYWGSNSVAMGHAFDLINAYEATKHQRYLDGAMDQVHYMLGRNTFGISFLTGTGAAAVSHPYHQFSMESDLGSPVPGMLVGGCNAFSRLNGTQLSPFPGRCYEDNEKNYFVNETAINYTAAFVYAAAYGSFPASDDITVIQRKGAD